MENQSLKIVVLFNAMQNRYTVLAHNATQEHALAVVQQNAERGTPLILDQRKSHATESPLLCRTCREAVAKQSNLEPKPKFIKNFPEAVAAAAPQGGA